MLIKEVISRKDLKRFVGFPDKLYRDCPQYVPALHSDQIHSLTKSASLAYCQRRMWLAVDENDNVVGRICAMINPHYNERYGKKCCRFGWFDTVEDYNVAKALIDTAAKWAGEQGMTQIHGPLYYNTLGKQGMLVAGFENVPQANTLYNYPYYPQFLEKMGFVKECDWVQYLMSDWHLPEKLTRISDALSARNKVHYGSIESLKRDPEKVKAFLHMYSEVFSRSVYNFIPFTEEEMQEEARQSIPMLSDRCCTLVLDQNEDVAAFGINFPSMSKALQKARGRLFPFGWFYILKALYGHNDTLDLMLTGASQQWQGRGLTALLHSDISRKAQKYGMKYFISNPQIETNSAAKVWENYDSAPYMRRRCYIKDLD